MAPKLFCSDGSPPVRAVYMTAAAIGLELDKKILNLFTGEHLTPDYLKLNPQHTIPTLQDGDFVVWDSHAITTYLIGTYAKDDSLYPKDLKKRAIIDQRLHFDSGVLFPRFLLIGSQIFRQGARSVPKDKADTVIEAYTILETFLGLSKYIVGNTMTLADLAICPTITSLNLLVPLAENRFPNICNWLEMMKALPYYETENGKGLKELHALFKTKMG